MLLAGLTYSYGLEGGGFGLIEGVAGYWRSLHLEAIRNLT
jgi:hypothetical protein